MEAGGNVYMRYPDDWMPRRETESACSQSCKSIEQDDRGHFKDITYASLKPKPCKQTPIQSAINIYKSTFASLPWPIP